jgi:hypothetical protein
LLPKCAVRIQEDKMVERIDDMPAGTVGFRAEGKPLLEEANSWVAGGR